MNNDVFETMPVPKAYFKMALPVVFGMVISLVYNMVDTWFIAKTQNTSLVAGVSLCAPVFQSHDCISVIFSGLAEVPPSQDFSEKKIMTPRGGSVLSAFSAPSSSALLLPF